MTKRTCPQCNGPKDFYAKLCRKCAVPGKPLLGVKGKDHPCWRGGFRIDRDGYIKTYAPDHPWPRRGGYVYEHVRRMELKLGRRLRKDEIVHHKNGNRQENGLRNLQLMQRGEHSKFHRHSDSHLRRHGKDGRFLAGREAASQ